MKYSKHLQDTRKISKQKHAVHRCAELFGAHSLAALDGTKAFRGMTGKVKTVA